MLPGSRRRAVREQQLAATKQQLRQYRQASATEVAKAQAAAVSEAERQMLLAAAATASSLPPLGQGHAAGAAAQQAYQALQEAASARQRAAHASAAERHAAALAARHLEVDRIKQQETERLQRLKHASLAEAQRTRAAAASYAVQQHQQQRGTAAGGEHAGTTLEAGAEAGPRQQQGSTLIDYRFTRLHDLLPPRPQAAASPRLPAVSAAAPLATPRLVGGGTYSTPQMAGSGASGAHRVVGSSAGGSIPRVVDDGFSAGGGRIPALVRSPALVRRAISMRDGSSSSTTTNTDGAGPSVDGGTRLTFGRSPPIGRSRTVVARSGLDPVGSASAAQFAMVGYGGYLRQLQGVGQQASERQAAGQPAVGRVATGQQQAADHSVVQEAAGVPTWPRSEGPDTATSPVNPAMSRVQLEAERLHDTQ